MYKLGYRATVFEPVTEAGWGILAGIGKPGARRSFAIDNDQAAKVMARAIEARAAAGVLPAPDDGTPARPAADVLADVAAVWPAGEDAAWNETLLERLAQPAPGGLRPVGARPAHHGAVRLRHHHRADRPPHRRQDRQPARPRPRRHPGRHHRT